jgi:hypothetical protein
MEDDVGPHLGILFIASMVWSAHLLFSGIS